MSYWDRVLGGQPRQPDPAPQPGSQPAWWRTQGNQPPTTPPQQDQQAVSPGYDNPNGWAVDDVHLAGKDLNLANRIMGQGYLSKPPSWARTQPTDACPECSSPRFAQISGKGSNLNGRYGGVVTIGGNGTPMQTLVIKRCFDCGYSTTGPMTDAMLGARVTHKGARVMGAARQTPSGGAVISNYHGDDPIPDQPF